MDPSRLPADLFELRDWVVDAYRDAATALRRSLEMWDACDATVDYLECILAIVRAGDPAEHAEDVRTKREFVADRKARLKRLLQNVEESAETIAHWEWPPNQTRQTAETLAQHLRAARDAAATAKNSVKEPTIGLAKLDQYVADLEKLARS